ncbi:Mitotic spindle-associated MMXD complex subunit MIP18 [Aphanomyces cochlioides]|nr:Mitotic spindle-associated MMXD complex subunit MIP18 [Aphanomyces cochlioides]
MAGEKQNANPTVYAVDTTAYERKVDGHADEDAVDPFDTLEVFEMLRHLNDPEHPLTLEQLKVMTLENILVDDAANSVKVQFTPTIPHCRYIYRTQYHFDSDCSMATLIGLCIRVKLLRSLPKRFKVDIRITPGTHITEDASTSPPCVLSITSCQHSPVNKQLNDKERVAAALENAHLLNVVNKCIANTDR